MSELKKLPRWKDLITKSATCWYWTGVKDEQGYGRWWDGRRSKGAHRIVYEAEVGPIPTGLTLDHLCRVKHCVNPAHLEPVTNAENIRRGNGRSARNARKVVCDNGHPFDEQNTYVHASTQTRHCRICRREQARARREREARRTEDYEAAVDALDSLLELIRTESISFEDESMRRSLSKIADARTVLRRLRDEVRA